MTSTAPLNDAEEFATGCAVTGRLLAFESLVRQEAGWMRSEPASRLFHLGERSRMSLRKLASEMHQFVSEQEIKRTACCITLTGDPRDETMIETLLCIIPGLELDFFDGNDVLRWSASAKPFLPRNVARSRQTLAQLWASDLVQFCQSSHRSEGQA